MRLTAIVLLLTALPSFAQTPEPLRRCLDTAGPQAEINRCFSDEATRAQAELNGVNQRLLAAVANNPQAGAKVTAAEKAWVVYRDAYVEAMWPAQNKQFEYGTSYITNALDLRIKLIRQHIEEVKELLKEHSGQNAH